MVTKKQQNSIDMWMKKFGPIGRLLINKMEVRELKKLLSQSEEIEAMMYGIRNAAVVFMVVTDRRLYYIDKRFMGSQVEDYYYDHIESVEYDLGVFAGMVRVVAPNGVIELKFVPNKFIRPFVTAVEYRIYQTRSSDNKSKNNDVDDLERLLRLKEKGAITPKEYITEKRKIISRD